MSETENQPRLLPVFNGYTVDLRLRQFRKAVPGVVLEFIDFESNEAYEKVLQVKGPKCPWNACGEDVTEYRYWLMTTNEGIFKPLLPEGTGFVDLDDTMPGPDREEFSCPHCKQLLFTSEEDARDFANGELAEFDMDVIERAYLESKA